MPLGGPALLSPLLGACVVELQQQGMLPEAMVVTMRAYLQHTVSHPVGRASGRVARSASSHGRDHSLVHPRLLPGDQSGLRHRETAGL